MEEKYQAVAPQLKNLVIKAMYVLITAKADSRGLEAEESRQRLMVSLYDIQTWMRNKGHEVPRVDIERALDVLTQKGGYARYYKWEHEGKPFIAYGLTKMCWASIAEQQAQRQEATA